MLDIVLVVREMVLALLIGVGVIIVTRRFSLPYTLGLVIVGLLLSVFGLTSDARLTPDLVLFVFLPALIFEGAWSLRLNLLRQNWWIIFLLAVPGLAVALLLIAVPIHFFAGVDWATALLLGAILSPTDPIAVLGLFRQLKVNASLSTVIEGESLFNDGVAGSLYQTFLAVVLLAIHGGAGAQGLQTWLTGIGSFVVAAGGGIGIGVICGFLAIQLVRYFDDPLIETTLTLVVAYGSYLLADTFHTSGIMSVICSALILSVFEPRIMSQVTHEAVDNFWTTLAFMANTVLFLLVGAQLNPAEFIRSGQIVPLLIMAGIAIAAVLIGRLVVVMLLPHKSLQIEGVVPRTWRFLIFWSGLRGALSMALVLALPQEVPNRYALIFATYAVVLFTLMVQGLSIRFLLKGMPSVTTNEKPLPSASE